MTRRWLLFGIIFLFAACGSPRTSTPAPTPEAIKIYYPASLKPWTIKLSGCAVNFPQVALYFLQLTPSNTNLGSDDILLELGQPSNLDRGINLTQLGQEQLVFIVNSGNSKSQLTTAQLQQIFAGEVRTWDAGGSLPIQVWVLPDGEPGRKIVDEALGLVQFQAPDAKLAPDPQAMLSAVSEDETAIGYVPQSFLISTGYPGADQVKRVTIATALQQNLTQPVIAATLGEPVDYVRGLLACMQK